MSKKDTMSEKSAGKTILQASGPKKKVGADILISNKINFQPQVIKKDKKGHFMLIKGKNLPNSTLNSEHLCSNARALHS